MTFPVLRTSLDALRQVCLNGGNTMPAILAAVRAYATTGEICAAIGDVFGSYSEPATV